MSDTRACTGEYSCRATEHALTCLYFRTPEMVHREAYTVVAASYVALAERHTAVEAELAALNARRCDGCKWWNRDERSTDAPHGYHECLMVKERGAAGAVYADEGGYELSTAPDHACRAWEAKPTRAYMKRPAP